MKYVVVDKCPVPAELADEIQELKRLSGSVLSSCYRGHDAIDLLHANGKMSQKELFDGFRAGRPGFNPANPPGFSTHELRSDGVAYPNGRGAALEYWQVGMDFTNSAGVVSAAAKLGWTATITYPGNPREGHHVNFRREPEASKPFPILKRGDRGKRVDVLTNRLAFVLDPETKKPYLESRQSVFDERVEKALKAFQEDHQQKADGVYGRQSHRQLEASVRARKQRMADMDQAKMITRRLSFVVDKNGKPYYGGGERGKLDAEALQALTRFQKDHGLEPDGVWGPKSAAMLDQEVRRRKHATSTGSASARSASTGSASSNGSAPSRISKRGRNLIAQFEGLRLAPYNDVANHATIGYGHLIHHGPVTPADREKFKGFTKTTALKLLTSDVRKFEQAVVATVGKPLTQRQLDACVSLAFNIGVGKEGFAGSTVVKRLKAGDVRGAADAFLMWNKATVGGQLKEVEGLTRRRKAEREYFLS